MLTIDASVWLNAFSPTEPGNSVSRAFVKEVQESATAVVVPTLLRVEIAAAASRVMQDPAAGHEYVQKVVALPSIRWIALDDPMARLAATVAAEHRLRGADAVYAAVAIAYGAALITLDQEHLTRLATVIRVQTPTEYLAARG